MKGYHKISFIFLLLAFLVSAAYQYYRSMVNEVPVHDGFGFDEIIIYVGLIGISSISLIDKKNASRFIIGFCITGYLISFTYYFPVIWVKRTIGWIDVAESVLYLLFLLLAALFSFVSLRKRKQSSIQP